MRSNDWYMFIVLLVIAVLGVGNIVLYEWLDIKINSNTAFTKTVDEALIEANKVTNENNQVFIDKVTILRAQIVIMQVELEELRKQVKLNSGPRYRAYVADSGNGDE